MTAFWCKIYDICQTTLIVIYYWFLFAYSVAVQHIRFISHNNVKLTPQLMLLLPISRGKRTNLILDARQAIKKLFMHDFLLLLPLSSCFMALHFGLILLRDLMRLINFLFVFLKWAVFERLLLLSLILNKICDFFVGLLIHSKFLA